MRFLFRLSMLTVFGAACLGISACTFPPRLYRMDVQQGSDITPEMVKRLRRGMSKEQVIEILGSPTLTHALDRDRWDYYFSLKPGMGGPFVEKHFTVFFSNNRLTNWSSDCV